MAGTALLAVVFAAYPAMAATVPEVSLGNAPAAESAEEPVADSNAGETSLEPGVRKMVEAAIASDDEATVAKVLALARKVAPDADPEIDTYETTWKARLTAAKAKAEEERLAKLRSPGVLENWKGDAEFGAYRSTGTSSSLGVLGSLELEREGFRWSHKVSGRAEVQSTNNETTAERVVAAWQPSYRFAEQAYTFGLAQYEHDPFAGYDDRYTLGGGLGYRAVGGGRLRLEIEGGPAYRYIEDTDGLERSYLVGRGSLNLNWKVTPTLTLAHKTAVYLEGGGDSNAVANTSLDTKVIGALKARFSYNIQYEGRPPLGTNAWNTQSRATFVYSF